MQTFKVTFPKHHKAQLQVMREQRRFNVLACARRWGKTTLGIEIVSMPALEGFPTGWFSPTYKSLSESWRELTQILKAVTVRKLETEHKLELVTGGSVEMWSLDTSNVIRGRKYKQAVVDEAAFIPNLKDAWQFTIRPTLTDMKGGAWFMSSPRGMNYFKALYDRGQDPLDEKWKSWQMPTATNPYIDPGEIEDAKKDLHELAFNQEYLAQFVSFEGAVFRHVQAAAIALPADGPVVQRQYVFGIDWGRTLDYTVVIVLDATMREVVAVERWGDTDYTVQRDRLKVLWRHWRPVAVLAESNSMGTPIIEQLYRDGMPVHPFLTTNATKAVAIEGLAMAFERGNLRIIPHAQLMAELQSFIGERLPSGLMRYTAPQGQHDDCVMALAIAWSAIESYQPQPMVVSYENRVHISPY